MAAQEVGEIIQRMGKLLQEREAERNAAFFHADKSRKRLLDMAGLADRTAAGYRRILEDIRKGGKHSAEFVAMNAVEDLEGLAALIREGSR